MPDASSKDLCIDVTDGDGRPASVAGFWSVALEQPAVPHDDGQFHLAPPERGSYVWIEGAEGFPFMFWVFRQVPEPKTAKNRVHWDVQLDTTIDGLVAAGATLLRPKDEEIRWWVMADPEGNEFCAFE
jgi:hypothetical protein